MLTLRGETPRDAPAREPLCADIDGFSLLAAVRVEAHERKRLEQLCRNMTRAAISDERMHLNAAGQVDLELKTPSRDGTTRVVMSPLKFMQRLAALLPRPRLYLVRSGVRISSPRELSGTPLREHRVLALNAKLRALVAPQGPPAQAEPATEAAAATPAAGARGGARLRSLSHARRPGYQAHRHGLRCLAAAAGVAAPHAGSPPEDSGSTRRSRPEEPQATAGDRPNQGKATTQAPIPSHPGRHRPPVQG